MGHVLEFSLERLTSLQLQVRDRSLTIVSAYEPNISVEYLAFLGALGGVLECSPTGNSTRSQQRSAAEAAVLSIGV